MGCEYTQKHEQGGSKNIGCLWGRREENVIQIGLQLCKVLFPKEKMNTNMAKY